jgi:phospholipase/carboxylesterase
MNTLLPHIQIESAPNPVAAVIWLHGLGADGNDFAGMAHELDLSNCPAIRFIFPHAPSRPVTLNEGYVMPAWYDVLSRDMSSQQDDMGIRASERAIVGLIEREVARGIPAKNIVLAGFSQGSAMVLHTGLRYPQALAGIMALSGYLPLVDHFAAERHPANFHTPIFMAHGIQDTVVPISRGETSRDCLVRWGYTLHWHTYPMQHSVHPQEVSDMSVFLQQVFSTSCSA